MSSKIHVNGAYVNNKVSNLCPSSCAAVEASCVKIPRDSIIDADRAGSHIVPECAKPENQNRTR